MAGDKRIRALQEAGGSILDYFLGGDKSGLLEAEKFTVQQVVNLAVSASAMSALPWLTGSTNPDNSTGSYRQIYLKITSTSISFWQKGLTVWGIIGSVINLGTSPDPIPFTADPDGNFDLSAAGLPDAPITNDIYSVLTGWESPAIYNYQTKQVFGANAGESYLFKYSP